MQLCVPFGVETRELEARQYLVRRIAQSSDFVGKGQYARLSRVNRDYQDYLDCLGFPVEHSWGQSNPTLSSEVEALISGEVMAEGSWNADLVFVGQSISRGPAGLLLDKMIQAMGYAREEVFLLSFPEEFMEKDDVLLQVEMEKLQPRVVVSLGDFATSLLLKKDLPFENLRGEFWDADLSFPGKFQVMPTFAPKALLVDSGLKKLAWADLQKVILALKV